MRQYLRMSLPVLLFAALLTAANAQAQQDVSMEGWPQWVQDAMQKELRKKKLRKVASGDDRFRSKMPGKPAKPESLDNGWYFSSDIRAEVPLECYIFTTAMDLATLTDLIAEANVGTVSETYGAINNRQIFHTGSGSIDGIPYLALEWLYTITGESQNLVAFTKVRAAAKGDVAFACAHNYLGYRDSFAYAFNEFVTNAEYEASDASPYYEEISQLDFNGIGTGIAYASYTFDEEGGTRMFTSEASLTPVDASTLIASDSATVTFMTAEGEFINSYVVDVESGEIVSDMRLQRGETNDWVVSGTLQGKPIEAELDGKVSPASQLQQIEMARDLFTGTESTISTNIWVPSIDPTRFLDAKMTRDDAEVERQAQLHLGPISYSGIFDESGNMTSSSMNVGPISIAIELIWSKGSLVQ